MVAGSSPDGGRAQTISNGVRNTIRSIKEIVRDHSESDIYAVLKETNMDPNETTQKLLDQDPFHEVRRRRDRKKENAGFNGTSTNDNKIQNEKRTERKQNVIRTESKHNEIRTDPKRNETESKHNEIRTESKHNEIRIDSKQNERRIEYRNERRREWIQNEGIITEYRKPERPWDRNGYSYSRAGIARGGYSRIGRGGYTRNSIPVPVKEYRIVRDNRTNQKSTEESEPISIQNPNATNPQVLISDNTENSSKQESPLSLSPNPIKSIPKKESTAEICSSSDPIHVSVGLVRREVGVVGLRKPNPNLFSENQRPQYLRPNSRGNNRLNSLPLPNLNQKAQQSNMEWRPKSSQSPRNDPALTLSGQQKDSDVNILSENLAKSKVSEDQHVIIPDHLRVPDSEQTHLIFGSFDSPKNSKEPQNQTSMSNEELSSGVEHSPNNAGMNESQLRENTNMQIDPSDEVGPQNIVTENVSHYESTLPHDLQDNSTDLQTFKEYDAHSRYEMQFLGEENGSTQQTTVIPTQAMSMSAGPTMMTTQIPFNHPQQQQQTMQNQNQNNLQQVPQMYPQLQLPQFATNYLPYRHVFSPVYMPQVQQIPVQNYQNTSPYPPPIATPVPNYLLMPSSGTGTVPTGGMKYGTNYKPVFSANGYGNYSNPNGYPGLIDDANRVKYKDNNTLYAPNLQVEGSDIWVQTPRELPPHNIQSTPFYQHQPTTPSYLAHNGPASYSATQQPYPPAPLHQTGQPSSMTLLPPPPHGGLHGLNGHNAPAGGPFQGSHHQQHLGHLGWTAANF